MFLINKETFLNIDFNCEYDNFYPAYGKNGYEARVYHYMVANQKFITISQTEMYLHGGMVILIVLKMEVDFEMSYTLLMTGTIDPTSFIGNINNLAVKDVSVRLDQYDTAIKRYITESCFDKIVFVETSKYPLDYKPYLELALQNNKEFEYISFLGNISKVQEKGKSYGEAEAILYALEHSKLLANEEIIYKVTGRIFLTNSHKIVQTKDLYNNEFISYFKYLDRRCVTYFFKFKKEDYLKYFSNTQDLVDDSNGIDIENVFYRKIIKLAIDRKPFQQGAFKYYPRMSGIIGGIGTPYDKPKWQYFIEDILLKLGVFTISI